MSRMDNSKRIAELEAECSRLRKLGRTKRQPNKGIGGVIQRAREEQGLGLRALAEKAGISAGLLSRIETYKNPNPRWNTIKAIADGLGMVTGELVARF